MGLRNISPAAGLAATYMSYGNEWGTNSDGWTAVDIPLYRVYALFGFVLRRALLLHCVSPRHTFSPVTNALS